MRELLAIILSLLVALLAAAAMWFWWRSPIPTFLVFTPVLQGILLVIGLHVISASLNVRRSLRWAAIAALAGFVSVVALTFGQYWSDAHAYRDATRRAAALVTSAEGVPGLESQLDVLESYDRNVLLPRTGKTGIRGYAVLRNGDVRWRGWLRFGEGLIVVVLAAVLSAPPRHRGAADDVAPQ